MTDLEGVSPDLLKVLHRHIEHPVRRAAAQHFIKNMVRVFESYSSDPTHCYWWMEGFHRFGDNWLKSLFAAVIAGFRDTPLFDICDFRIASGPVEDVSLCFRLPCEGGVAQRHIRTASHMNARRVRWWYPVENGITQHGKDEVWFVFFEELLNEIIREVVGTMYGACENRLGMNPPWDGLVPGAQVLGEIERQSDHINRSIGVGGATHLVVGPELASLLPFEPDANYKPSTGFHRAGRLQNRWDVYFDPSFITGTIMLWNHRPWAIDKGAVAMLYSMHFTTRFEMASVRYNRYVSQGGDYFRIVRAT